MREMGLMRFVCTGVATMSVLVLSGCPTECPDPPQLERATYMERVNCDLGGECVNEDEMDTVMVEPDPEDATRFAFTSQLRAFTANAIFVCGPRAEYQVALGANRLEEGEMIFSENPDTYTRTATVTENDEELGACTGNASKVGPPGPPEAVGTCPNPGGTGGTGGCVPFATDVGGTESAPVVWEERYTCVDRSGGCLGDEDIAVALELIQNAERIDWSIAQGIGQDSEYSGELCDTSFRWESKPGTESEEGCWEFNDTQFNKRSFGSGFFCIGTGRKGAGSKPVPPPTCQQIAALDVDFSACPLPPPASPIQGDPATCDGTVQFEPMTSDITCTSPDPCDGCNEYCLGNGFPYGGTGEPCSGFVCECTCSYCRPG